jgi:DNA-binding Lrp family transcriptional regulator
MLKALVHVRVKPGAIGEVLDEIMQIDGVTAAFAVSGEYDIIAVVEAPDVGTLSSIIRERIHGLKPVLKTNTCVVFEERRKR